MFKKIFERIKDFFRSFKEIDSEDGRVSMSSLSAEDWGDLSDKSKMELLSESPIRINNIKDALKDKAKNAKRRIVGNTKGGAQAAVIVDNRKQNKNKEQDGYEHEQ